MAKRKVKKKFTEEKLRADGWGSMNSFIQRQESARKKLLTFCGCCRCVWEHVTLECNRRAVEASERYADGLATPDELKEHWDATRFEPAVYHSWLLDVTGPARRDNFYLQLCPQTPEDNAALAAFHPVYTREFQARVQAGWVACGVDVFGHFCHPGARIDPQWLTSDVLALARGIYAERAFDRTPILADALQDAGCDDEDVLAHCRDAARPHVRGCWVVDLVLGKS